MTPHASRDVIPSRPAPGENWFEDDPALAALLAAHLDGARLKDVEARCHALGAVAPQRIDPASREADRFGPVLRRYGPEGARIDEVDFHPSYRELQKLAREHETFTLAWRGYPRVAAFALGYLFAQAESGYYCPACMTDGAAFVLSRHVGSTLTASYVPRLVQRETAGALEGAMYLTEKGGGSDVGGGTAATARHVSDGSWRLTGEKWFASNCVADVALALARVPGAGDGTRGLGLFVVPRVLADGSRNPGVHLERIKDKLGVRSMPTGEILLEDAYAEMVAAPPGGFKAMAEMVNLSRLYNAVASVAVARRALREAQRAGRARLAFGKPVAEQPLFVRALAEFEVDLEGALAVTFETAAVFDRFAASDPKATRMVRALTPCVKAMAARLSVDAASFACEALGGVGYIEDYVTPRLLRDAQVLPIWEGTTNIQALEFARAHAKDGALALLIDHVRSRLGNVEAPLVRTALDALLGEAAEASEAGALRVLRRTYHVTAAALLCDLAARPGASSRSALVARTYTWRHLAAESDTRERAVEALPRDDVRRLAFPQGA